MSTYQPIQEHHHERLIAIMAYTFHADLALVRQWLGRAGLDAFRVIATGPDVEACLLRTPMGIWFGGRAIDNVGIAGVGVAPEHRGEGHAKRMMVELCRELHAEGVPISTLYPATVGLYRRVGYGMAGDLFAVHAKTEALHRFESRATVRAMTDADVPTVKALEERTRRADGNLARGHYVWSRVFAPRFEETEKFVVIEDDTITGYLVFTKRSAGFLHDFACTDLVATTPDSHRRILDFLFTHRSFVKNVSWSAPPNDAFLALWPEKAYDIELEMTWMLRLTHVANALAARGYPEDVKAAITFEVTDEHVPGNAGAYTVQVADGRGAVTRFRGANVVRIDVRDLATLFAGYRSASTLRALGALDADDDTIAIAERLFVPRAPHMNHLF